MIGLEFPKVVRTKSNTPERVWKTVDHLPVYNVMRLALIDFTFNFLVKPH